MHKIKIVSNSFFHLSKLLHISFMVAASSTVCFDEVGHSVSPDDVFCVKVFENACKHMRNVLTRKAGFKMFEVRWKRTEMGNVLKCFVAILSIG